MERVGPEPLKMLNLNRLSLQNPDPKCCLMMSRTTGSEHLLGPVSCISHSSAGPQNRPRPSFPPLRPAEQNRILEPEALGAGFWSGLELKPDPEAQRTGAGLQSEKTGLRGGQEPGQLGFGPEELLSSSWNQNFFCSGPFVL